MTRPAWALPGLLAWTAVWAATGGTSLPTQLGVCLPIVAVFGVPHGATDWWLARHSLHGRLGRAWAPVFGLYYALAGGMAAAAIYAAPTPALALFIAASVWHFGSFDARVHGVDGGWLACGLPPMAAPCAFRPHDVARLFAAMGVALEPRAIAFAGLAGLCAAACAFMVLPRRPAFVAEAGCLMLLWAMVPPVPAFTAYFCGLHAPRQWRALGVRGAPAVLAVAAVSAVALIAAPLGMAVSLGRIHPTDAAVQGLFWGLAVLSLPHMLCGWLLGPPSPSAIEVVS